jgi:hypothetical protein
MARPVIELLKRSRNKSFQLLEKEVASRFTEPMTSTGDKAGVDNLKPVGFADSHGGGYEEVCVLEHNAV